MNYGGGQQILVCEPQKSAFFRADFAKKHAEINSLCPICLSCKIQLLNSFKIPDIGFHLCMVKIHTMNI